MGLYRREQWGGDLTGKLVVANEPFRNRFGHCYFEKNKVNLPNGLIIEGVRGKPVADYLAVGTLAVAVAHSGDYYNTYVPVTVDIVDQNTVLTPWLDLKFGAYTFGQVIGEIRQARLHELASGIPVIANHVNPEVPKPNRHY